MAGLSHSVGVYTIVTYSLSDPDTLFAFTVNVLLPGTKVSSD